MSLTFSGSIDNDLSAVFFNANEFAKRVTITRGAASTNDIAAIHEVRTYEVADEGGIMTAIESHDWDFISTEYVFSGTAATPRHGDRITGPDSVVYEVLPMQQRKCFDSAGTDGRVWRVHTKKVS